MGKSRVCRSTHVSRVAETCLRDEIISELREDFIRGALDVKTGATGQLHRGEHVEFCARPDRLLVTEAARDPTVARAWRPVFCPFRACHPVDTRPRAAPGLAELAAACPGLSCLGPFGATT